MKSIISFLKSKPIELLGTIVAIGAFCLQYESLQEQKVIGAWQILTTRASGDSGKKEAIEFLAKQGISLQGIDMSSKNQWGTGLFGGVKFGKG